MEQAKFDAYKKKLDGLCDEHNLVYSLKTSTYPITLTISPNHGLDAQMMMLEMADEQPYNSPDAKLVFQFVDGALIYTMSERFTLADTTFQKIKNLFKNLHFTYLQFFHRDLIENNRLPSNLVPQPEEDDDPEAVVEEFDPEDMEDILLEDAVPDDDVDSDAFDVEDSDGEDMTSDEYMLRKATAYARENGSVNASRLVEALGISYSAAANLMEKMEDAGVIGIYDSRINGRVFVGQEV